ncbi:MAG: DMT family transporter [Nitrospinota bacterium]
MPPEIAFALLSLGLLGLNDFLYKWGQRWDLRGGPFMLLQNFAYVPNALALAWWRGDLAWSPGLLYGALNGFLAFTAFLFLLVAMRRGEAVALVPIVRLNFAVTAALTVSLLGESLTWTKGAALVLAALAVLAGGSGVLAAGGGRRSLLLALSAMCLFGVIGLFYKLALRAGAPPAAITVAQGMGVTLAAVPFAIWRGDPLPRPGPAMWVPLACGVLTSSSYVALAVAFTHGEAVVVAPIAQLSFVLTGLLAVAFLGERMTPRKGAGVLFAALAVVLFARG